MLLMSTYQKRFSTASQRDLEPQRLLAPTGGVLGEHVKSQGAVRRGMDTRPDRQHHALARRMVWQRCAPAPAGEVADLAGKSISVGRAKVG